MCLGTNLKKVDGMTQVKTSFSLVKRGLVKENREGRMANLAENRFAGGGR
jgi:hypothetical protein